MAGVMVAGWVRVSVQLRVARKDSCEWIRTL
jgi:hypothetical protein